MELEVTVEDITVHPGRLIEEIVAAYMAAQCGWQGTHEYHGHTDCWKNGEEAGRAVMESAGFVLKTEAWEREALADAESVIEDFQYLWRTHSPQVFHSLARARIKEYHRDKKKL